ncbi:type VI secretion system tube protein TssD [Sinomicrobium sp. M5D2P17]
MATFLSKLFIDGSELTVLDCSFTFEKGSDNNGKPSTRAMGGQISLLLAVNKDDSLFGWMLSDTMTKDGKIIFYKDNAMAKMQELAFKKAYCLKYDQRFNADSSSPMQVEIVISALEVTYGAYTYKSKWPGVSSLN